MVGDVFLTVAQVAQLLHVSPATVRRHAKIWGGIKMRGARQWLFHGGRIAEHMFDGRKVG